MEHDSDDYTKRDWFFRYSYPSIIKGTGGFGSWRTSEDHPNYSIVENGQKTEKSPVDLMRLAVAQTPVKDHQLMLMRKTLNNNNNSTTFYGFKYFSLMLLICK